MTEKIDCDRWSVHSVWTSFEATECFGDLTYCQRSGCRNIGLWIANNVSFRMAVPSKGPTESGIHRQVGSEDGRQPPRQKFLLRQDSDAGRDNHKHLEGS
jgi:hypothetical protein